MIKALTATARGKRIVTLRQSSTGNCVHFCHFQIISKHIRFNNFLSNLRLSLYTVAVLTKNTGCFSAQTPKPFLSPISVYPISKTNLQVPFHGLQQKKPKEKLLYLWLLGPLLTTLALIIDVEAALLEQSSSRLFQKSAFLCVLLLFELILEHQTI